MNLPRRSKRRASVLDLHQPSLEEAGLCNDVCISRHPPVRLQTQIRAKLFSPATYWSPQAHPQHPALTLLQL